MQERISKSKFKPKALEVMRRVEETGESVIITDHDVPTLELRVYRDVNEDPFEKLKGSVSSYHDPTLPVADDDWALS